MSDSFSHADKKSQTASSASSSSASSSSSSSVPSHSAVHNELYDDLDPMPPELIELIIEYEGHTLQHGGTQSVAQSLTLSREPLSEDETITQCVQVGNYVVQPVVFDDEIAFYATCLIHNQSSTDPCDCQIERLPMPFVDDATRAEILETTDEMVPVHPKHIACVPVRDGTFFCFVYWDTPEVDSNICMIHLRFPKDVVMGIGMSGWTSFLETNGSFCAGACTSSNLWAYVSKTSLGRLHFHWTVLGKDNTLSNPIESCELDMLNRVDTDDNDHEVQLVPLGRSSDSEEVFAMGYRAKSEVRFFSLFHLCEPDANERERHTKTMLVCDFTATTCNLEIFDSYTYCLFGRARKGEYSNVDLFNSGRCHTEIVIRTNDNKNLSLNTAPFEPTFETVFGLTCEGDGFIATRGEHLMDETANTLDIKSVSFKSARFVHQCFHTLVPSHLLELRAPQFCRCQVAGHAVVAVSTLSFKPKGHTDPTKRKTILITQFYS